MPTAALPGPGPAQVIVLAALLALQRAPYVTAQSLGMSWQTGPASTPTTYARTSGASFSGGSFPQPSQFSMPAGGGSFSSGGSFGGAGGSSFGKPSFSGGPAGGGSFGSAPYTAPQMSISALGYGVNGRRLQGLLSDLLHAAAARLGQLTVPHTHDGGSSTGSGTYHVDQQEAAGQTAAAQATPTRRMPCGSTNSTSQGAGSNSSSDPGHSAGGQQAVTDGGRVPEGPRHARGRITMEQGTVATVEGFPYVLVLLRPSDASYLCVGTAIAPRVVVTAAHCVAPDAGGTRDPLLQLPRDSFSLPAGKVGSSRQLASGRRLATVSLVHPMYSPATFDYDVAALVLARDATQLPAVKLVGESAALAPHTDLQVAGWGATDANQLSPLLLVNTHVQQVDSDQCQALYTQYASVITRRMLCATGQTCAGDSGGPLLAYPPGTKGDPSLLGHVSFGFPRQQGHGCPSPNPATVFADLRAPRINRWLRRVLAAVEADDAQGAAVSGASAGAAGQGSGAARPQLLQVQSDGSLQSAVAAGAAAGGAGFSAFDDSLKQQTAAMALQLARMTAEDMDVDYTTTAARP